jgi:Winged helix DNA-binding domain
LRVLTRQELTAALAARQGLNERWRTTPAEAIRRLTPLQGQEAPAPYVGLAARVEGFERQDLEAAFDAREVVKTTIMRLTLHVAAAAEYPAYAQLCRQPRLRTWRKTYPHLDEAAVIRELRAWFDEAPRTNAEVRETVGAYEGVAHDPWTPVIFARSLLPLVQLPPAGHWRDKGRDARFVVDPRPLPDPADAAALVLERYLDAFGPASKRDVAMWSGAAQRDFDFTRVPTVSYRDEKGVELLDLPGREIPRPTSLPPRFLGAFDQVLLAHADRDRIIPPEIQPLQLPVAGAQTVTVDGRVAASWTIEDGRIAITPHADFPREAVREEALRTARFVAPDAPRHQVAFAT